jgi:ribonucleoside-triphosphate reductase (thioredoxin)
MKILSVTTIVDEQDYYDITVEDTHNFLLANGSIVHNCGTGVGFSVERQHIAKLPIVGTKAVIDAAGKLGIETTEQLTPSDHVIVVRDSKGGWATAYKDLIHYLYAGHIPSWDVSKVRPAGAKLKVFGGRASGPQPLVDLFKFTVETFKEAVGRKLTSIECHDLVCKIADIVVVGGVRRSALISLSNLSDDRMRAAKSGQWWANNPQRALANNSAAYHERPSMELFMKEWLSLVESKSGERGVFNRQAVFKKAAATGRRDPSKVVGTNPCAEISLRSAGLCNLSEVVIRSTDSLQDLLDKVRIATIIGTYQSLLTNFRHVRSIWKDNQEEERLLGVSLTGIMDHPVLSQSTEQTAIWLQRMKEVAISVNKMWAQKLGIKPAAAITTVKPSGTVSQLVDSASGIHPRYSHHYIRTVRADKKDPLAQLMRQQGFPVEDCVLKGASTDVFSFPVAGPKQAVYRNDRTALQQLQHYLIFQKYWCEHNVSVTIYVKDHEWMGVGDWVYQHFDEIAGVSFLPHSDHSYQQAPFQEIDEKGYSQLLAKMPSIDWDALAAFEQDDSTVNVKELACTAGHCDII